MNRRTLLKKISITLALLSGTAWSSYSFAEKDDDDDEHEEHTEQHGSENEPVNNNAGSNDHDNSAHQSLNDYEEYDDEEHALQATQANQAMPLRNIIRIFRREVGGTITEITLHQLGATLIYRFQFINSDGHVVYVKYNAATGQQIEN